MINHYYTKSLEEWTAKRLRGLADKVDSSVLYSHSNFVIVNEGTSMYDNSAWIFYQKYVLLDTVNRNFTADPY